MSVGSGLVNFLAARAARRSDRRWREQIVHAHEPKHAAF
jgi:hypothetical protein